MPPSRSTMRPGGVQPRWLVAVASVTLMIAACTSSSPETGSSSEASGSPGVTTAAPTTGSTTTTSAPPPPYLLPDDEVEPDLKIAAVRFVEALLSYGPSSDPLGEAVSRLAAGAFDPALGAAAAPLLVAEATSEVVVLYPQLGGLEPNEAAVMVVAEHRLIPADCCPSSIVRTLDVRLTRHEAGWAVTGLESVGGQPPVESSGAASDLAQQVLSDVSIRLPDSARWDIEAGLVADEILLLLLDLSAAGHALDVTSFASGHPVNVFGRPFVSNHTRGRAVDIWAVDGERVTGSVLGSGAQRVVERSLAFGATEVGSPWDPDGPGGAAFTNALHADHLHLAFDP